ncbi:MAG: hypothetical protein ACI4MH_06735 [Candidatus Coproplasma sp.]
MDGREFQELKNYLARNRDLSGQPLSDLQCEAQSEKKLHGLLSERPESYDREDFKRAKAEISGFMKSGEAQKRKLLQYCTDFTDPTLFSSGRVSYAGEERVNYSCCLEEKQINDLLSFVKRHKTDNSFGMLVYDMINKRGVTPPQVYKAAMMRRQDFSRATDLTKGSVTKLVAWQIIMGLKCSKHEAEDLLFSAGYVIRNTQFDLVMLYFIEHKNYDILTINEVLDELKLKPFSCYRQE